MRCRFPLRLLLMVGVVACSVESLTFSRGIPPPTEDCAAAGDEDANGLADCADAACAELTTCALVCGNGRVDPGEQCDDGNLVFGDGCDSACSPSSVTYVKASNTAADDGFGFSLALSADGSTLAVGAYLEDSAATGIDGDQGNNLRSDAGAVYVYVHSGMAWKQQAYIKASNTDTTDRFGYSVALSADGSTLAVGAYLEDSPATGVDGEQSSNGANGAGAAYVYVRTGAIWTQQAYIKASNTGAGDLFGRRLALSGDGSTLAVAAYQEDSAATGIDGDQTDTGSNTGAVYVYARNGSSWSQQAYVKASNTGATDQFGTSVALSGDGSTLAVGAIGEDSAATGIDGDQTSNGATDSGAAYVYVRTGTTWRQQAYVKASNAGPGDVFGYTVALSGSGSTLAVGAFGEDSTALGTDGDQTSNGATNAGAAYVYVRTGTSWSQQAYVKASNTDANDEFGTSVALSADGSNLAVGAPFEDSAATGINGDQVSNSAIDSGAAYVYVRNGIAWRQQTFVKAPNTGVGDLFGIWLAFLGTVPTLTVGANGEDSAATGINGDQTSNSAIDAGAVYLYR